MKIKSSLWSSRILMFAAILSLSTNRGMGLAQEYEPEIAGHVNSVYNSFALSQNGNLVSVSPSGLAYLRTVSGKKHSLKSDLDRQFVPSAVNDDGTVLSSIVEEVFAGVSYCVAYSYNPFQNDLKRIEIASRKMGCMGKSMINNQNTLAFTLDADDSTYTEALLLTQKGIRTSFEITDSFATNFYFNQNNQLIGSISDARAGDRLVVMQPQTEKKEYFPLKTRESFSLAAINNLGQALIVLAKNSKAAIFDITTEKVRYLKRTKDFVPSVLGDRGQVAGSIYAQGEYHAALRTRTGEVQDLSCLLPNDAHLTLQQADAISKGGTILTLGSPTDLNVVGQVPVLLKPGVVKKNNYCVTFRARMVGQCSRYFESSGEFITQTLTYPYQQEPRCTLEAELLDAQGSPLVDREVVLLAGAGSYREVKVSAKTNSKGIVTLQYPITLSQSYSWELRFWRDNNFRSVGIPIFLKNL